MITQETYVNVNGLCKQGWTINEIAAETGWHRTTISDRLKNGFDEDLRGILNSGE